ncbi:MAG TPA: 16S rRNA (cytidine(1402)-2'-O)-methyltransferase [Erysipelothrix sp.]|nr:16S rRNA (cytidine(1402)-2'-O)-methyltransferase [Erysipelothrix sp.]
MKIQKSFQNDVPSLYLVATPIGNLKEMTPRAIEVLKSVDLILAEDTRTSGHLLKHFEINTPTMSYHMHNEKQRLSLILDKLNQGQNIALISDAGYPLIADPGQTLVSEVTNHNYNVIPISGSSAFLNALVASGLVTQPFVFMGFLENKKSLIKEQLDKIIDCDMTSIFYVSVHKLKNSLEILYDTLGNRKIVLVRELTKMHEEFIRTDLKTINENDFTLKGEFVLVIEASFEKEIFSIETLLEKIEEEIQNGLSPSRSISKVAKDYNYSKNELYNHYQTKIKN